MEMTNLVLKSTLNRCNILNCSSYIGPFYVISIYYWKKEDCFEI